MNQKRNVNIVRWVFILVIPFIVSGCYSSLKVHKIIDNNIDKAPGIRYSLPKPFLLVTPSETGDGTFKVEVVHLPDEEQTYAIDAKSGMGKHTLEVEVEKGLLKKILWKKDDTTVPAEVARVAGELAKKELERKKAEQEEQEAKVKEAMEKVQTLEKELRDKELELELANVELESLKEAVDDEATATEKQKEELRQARLKVKKIQIELENKRKELSLASSLYETLRSNFNVAKGSSDKFKKAWGPVLYAIEDKVDYRNGKGYIKLKTVKWKTLQKPIPSKSPWSFATDTQKQFETVTAPKPPPEIMQEPKLTFDGSEILPYTGGKIVIRRTFDKPVRKFVHTPAGMSYYQEHPGGKKTNLTSKNFVNSKKQDLVVILNNVAVGEYTLHVTVEWGSNNKTTPPKSVLIDFEVVQLDPASPPQITTQGIEAVYIGDTAKYFSFKRTFTGKIKRLKVYKSFVEKRSSFVNGIHVKQDMNILPITMKLEGQELIIKIGKGMEPGLYKLHVFFDYNDSPGRVKEARAAIDFRVPK
jgi:hypothetical protein